MVTLKAGQEIVGKTKQTNRQPKRTTHRQSSYQEDIQGIQIPTTPTLINRVDSLQPLW